MFAPHTIYAHDRKYNECACIPYGQILDFVSALVGQVWVTFPWCSQGLHNLFTHCSCCFYAFLTCHNEPTEFKQRSRKAMPLILQFAIEAVLQTDSLFSLLLTFHPLFISILLGPLCIGTCVSPIQSVRSSDMSYIADLPQSPWMFVHAVFNSVVSNPHS